MISILLVINWSLNLLLRAKCLKFISKGGHGISNKDIERRYYDSLDSLKEDIKLCDEINICDNTEMFREIIDFQNSKIVWVDNKIPTWAIKLLEK